MPSGTRRTHGGHGWPPPSAPKMRPEGAARHAGQPVDLGLNQAGLGVLVVRSQLNTEILEVLCWRGDSSLPLALAVGAVLLSSQMPKAA